MILESRAYLLQTRCKNKKFRMIGGYIQSNRIISCIKQLKRIAIDIATLLI